MRQKKKHFNYFNNKWNYASLTKFENKTEDLTKVTYLSRFVNGLYANPRKDFSFCPCYSTI